MLRQRVLASWNGSRIAQSCTFCPAAINARFEYRRLPGHFRINQALRSPYARSTIFSDASMACGVLSGRELIISGNGNSAVFGLTVQISHVSRCRCLLVERKNRYRVPAIFIRVFTWPCQATARCFGFQSKAAERKSPPYPSVNWTFSSNSRFVFLVLRLGLVFRNEPLFLVCGKGIWVVEW